jgi:hypothetical protein
MTGFVSVKEGTPSPPSPSLEGEGSERGRFARRDYFHSTERGRLARDPIFLSW